MPLASQARSNDISEATCASSDDRIVLRVGVQVTNLSGERYWTYDTPLPSQVQISVNINIVGVDQKSDSTVEAPFVFTVGYTPSIAQLSVKGKAQVSADRSEVIVMSKSLGIPPPLPPIGLPAEASPTQPVQRKESRYTT